MIGHIYKITNGITFFESTGSTIYVLKNRTNVRNYRTNLNYLNQIISRKVGRSKLYTLANNEFAKTLKKVLTADKTLLDKIEKETVRKLKKFKPISIVLYGSALKGLKKGSDVDIAVIVDKSVTDSLLARVASEIDTKYGIEVSILPLEAREFKKRVEKGDEFVINLLANHKLLYGKKLEDLLVKARKSINQTKRRISCA